MVIIYNRNSRKRLTKDVVIIDRNTKWGNPFIIGQSFKGKPMTRAEVIQRHKDWLFYSDQGQELLKDISELIDKDLACWCKPLACHGDNLTYAARLAKEGSLWEKIKAGVI